ncbi:hypothetical protein [Modestobacter sp. Leaf380]|uniref:hypothetical protein n=1 Tax=Modestobacter sp. Leaf380 TaxID=1736356 RepID=UPI0006F1F499|nr:hypothetical protein [Modestobacter sp. Leaf380]KQS66949.1 hypothetical protein ASG41_11265 [Modestobacter sp. Leaf380]
MTAAEPVVRLAQRRDVPRLAATLAAAYPDYRWTSWAFPEDGRAQRVHRWHELVAGLAGVDAQTTWVTDDCAAVATWTPPGDPAPAADLQAVLDRDLPKVFGSRHRVVQATDRIAAAGRPETPHWWLVSAGTRPSQRFAGLSRAVVTPVLDRCDADGVPAALAAYTSGVVHWAEALGFVVTQSTRSAVDHELPVWTLVRPPRGA